MVTGPARPAGALSDQTLSDKTLSDQTLSVTARSDPALSVTVLPAQSSLARL
jgi:hypothetical protein